MIIAPPDLETIHEVHRSSRIYSHLSALTTLLLEQVGQYRQAIMACVERDQATTLSASCRCHSDTFPNTEFAATLFGTGSEPAHRDEVLVDILFQNRASHEVRLLYALYAPQQC